MRTQSTDTTPAKRAFADRTFREQFPGRLSALAGLLNALAESGPESTQSVFIEPTLHFVSELASDLARECAAWAATHQAQDDQAGGVQDPNDF